MRKNIILIIIALTFFLSTNSYSVFYPNYVKKSDNTSYTGYKIVTPGELKSDGTYTPAKLHLIEKVNPKYYIQGTLHFKIKNNLQLDKERKSFMSAAIMQSLSQYNIKNIRGIAQKKDFPQLMADDKFGLNRIYEINYSDAVDPYDVCMDLMRNPEIEYATPVFIRYYNDFTPNDPSVASQWALTNMNMKKAWDLSKGDSAITIAIVDCGTDWNHEDLKANVWTNPKEIPGNGIDDDKNGKIDDVYGWDLIGNITFNDVAMGNYKEDNDATNYGNGYHGTHVAGCADAVTNNSKGVAGIGYNCSFIPIKCSIDNNQQAILRAYEGIAYAANLGADIINCSWGGPGYSPSEQDIINAAMAKGSLVLVAAGNDYHQNIDEEPMYPASYNNVVCVGATDSKDKITSFSNLGWLVTVYTPGQGIYATMPSNKYGNLDGTSMATPNTAGLAALIKTVHRNWTPKQILHQLRSTCDNVVTTDATQRPYYYGRVNGFNALDYNNGNTRNVPGVEISEVSFYDGDALRSFDQTKIKLKVKNYLATASNLKVKITPQGNALSVSANQLNVGELKELEEKSFDVYVQLTNLNPWYIGYVNLQVTFESGTYTDYQLVKIPVSLSSKNAYNVFYSFKDSYDPSLWSQAVAVNESQIWAAGEGGASFAWRGGALRILSASPQMGPITQSGEGAYCVHAFDINKAFFGTGTSNNTTAKVISTTDGGNNWINKDVSTITGFINAIYFFNDQNGIFLGDPKNNIFGIAATADGGESWDRINNPPVALSGESGQAGAAYWLKTFGWFGTTKGRILRSTDMGISWKASVVPKAAIIYQILFKDVNNGIAIYAESTSRYAPRIVASTNDGGITWIANKFNFGSSNLNPVYIYSCDETDLIILLCSAGQVYGTTDNGNTWSSILSAFHGNIQIGAGAFYGKNKIRLWDFGERIGFLDFSFVPKNIDRQIQVNSGSGIDYDTLDLGLTRTRNLMVTNIGNYEVNTQYEIIPGSETLANDFKILGDTTETIDADKSSTIRIKFNPATIGPKEATLKITSNAKQNIITVNLKGVAITPVSVQSGIPEKIPKFKLYPNPAEEFTTIYLNGLNKNEIQIKITDLIGKEIKSTNFNTNSSEAEAIIDLKGIKSGLYLITISNGFNTVTEKLIIK